MVPFGSLENNVRIIWGNPHGLRDQPNAVQNVLDFHGHLMLSYMIELCDLYQEAAARHMWLLHHTIIQLNAGH